MIHHKKNYLFYKDATCQNLWPRDFTDVTAFSSPFFLALHYCFFLYIFFLLWLFWGGFLNFYQVLFHGSFTGHLSPLSAAFSGRFFSLFCPVLLGGWFLALRKAPISSDWFFILHSLGPSSTQLLVRNHIGFCSHWYWVGLLFLLSASFYRLCISLPPCFSFKWFCFFLVVCRVLFSLSVSFHLVSLDLNVLGYHRTYQNFKIRHQFRTVQVTVS